MVSIPLDHIQRLNLHAMLGNQPFVLKDMRAAWKLQDRLDLDEAEAAKIGLNRDTMQWTPGSALDPEPYEFSEAEVVLIRGALQNTSSPANNRKWLEPLLQAFLEE